MKNGVTTTYWYSTQTNSYSFIQCYTLHIKAQILNLDMKNVIADRNRAASNTSMDLARYRPIDDRAGY